jgi:hypothetical protein
VVRSGWTVGTLGPVRTPGVGSSAGPTSRSLLLGGRPFPAGASGVTAILRPGSFALAARSPIVAIAPAVAGPAVGTAHQLGRDTRPVAPTGAQELDALGLGPAALLGCQDRHDGDAFDLELGLGPENVAGLGFPGKQTAVHHTPWLSGASGTPGP